MKAVQIAAFGGPEGFEIAERPLPEPQPGQVRVRVQASSVNPLDCRIRAGGGAALAPELPAVLHRDVAGVIDAVGEGVSAFRRGDAVYGCTGGVRGHGGALAEFTLCEAALLAQKPANLSFAEAAALPLVTVTAWEGLYQRARIEPGERLLVTGGSGGVGHIAVQLGAIAGAEVAASVSSPAKAALVERLGARHTILRGRESLADAAARLTAGEGFDAVFDSVGGAAMIAHSFTATRSGGRVVTVQARAEVALTEAHLRNLTLHVEFMLAPLLTGRGRAAQGEILRRAARLVEAGRLKPLLDERRFGFSQAGAAHRHWESGAAVGKIVLENDL